MSPAWVIEAVRALPGISPVIRVNRIPALAFKAGRPTAAAEAAPDWTTTTTGRSAAAEVTESQAATGEITVPCRDTAAINTEILN